MKTWCKIIISLLPLIVWLGFVVRFEWGWHEDDPMSDTGSGFGAVALYQFGLLAALVLSVLSSVLFYATRSKR